MSFTHRSLNDEMGLRQYLTRAWDPGLGRGTTLPYFPGGKEKGK